MSPLFSIYKQNLFLTHYNAFASRYEDILRVYLCTTCVYNYKLFYEDSLYNSCKTVFYYIVSYYMFIHQSTVMGAHKRSYSIVKNIT